MLRKTGHKRFTNVTHELLILNQLPSRFSFNNVDYLSSLSLARSRSCLYLNVSVRFNMMIILYAIVTEYAKFLAENRNEKKNGKQ